MKLKQFEGIEKNELAMVNVAHAILETTENVTEFNDLLAQVSEYLEYEDDQLEEEMIQFYTDLNTDGRFISLGENRWGLREWYPVDFIDEELTHENDIEDLTPRINKEGFDDYQAIEEEEYGKIDEDENETEEDEEEVEYGDSVEVDKHGVMLDDEDEEDLGEYKEDVDDLPDEGEDLEGLSVVDDEEILEDEEEEEE